MRVLLSVAVVCLTSVPCPAFALDAKRPMEPHFVVRCKPVDDWIASLANLTNGTPENKRLTEYFELLQFRYLGALKLDLDRTRPFGVYGFLNKDFDQMPDFFALVPITEEDAFFDLLKRAKCQVTKGNDGVHAVTAPMAPMPLHLRFANKYAYLSSLDKAAFAKADLLEPAKIAPLKGDNALATMVFRLDSIPLAVRKEAVAKTHEQSMKTYKEQLQAMPKTTDPAERAGREIGEKAVIALATDIQNFAASCIEDGDQVILRLDDHWIIEMKVTPKPRSRLTTSLASMGQTKSRFAGLAGKNAIAALNLRFNFPEKARQSLEAAIDPSIDELLKNIKEEKERELTSKAFKALMPTLKAGEIDVAFALRKGPNDQFATALFAAQIKDGAAVEQLLRDLNKEAGDKKLPIKFDVAKHGNVAIHRIDAKDLKGKGKGDPDFTSELGENPAYLAVTSDALFVTAGANGLDAIKQVIDSKPGACPPCRMQFGIAYLMAENAKNRQDKAMYKRLSGNFGLTVEGGDALTVRVEGLGILPGALVVGMEMGFEKAKEPVPKEPVETDPVIEALVAINTAGFENVKPGQTLKLKGLCGSLRNGKISLSISKPYTGYRPAIAAPDLLKEFTKDAKGAEKKYGTGAIVVEGVVQERKGQSIILSGTKAPQAGKETAPAPSASPLAKAASDFTLTADEFAAEFKKDPKAYDQKYGGKVIDLSGTVRSFQDYGGGASIFVEAKGRLLGVLCSTVDDEPWAQVSPGQKIKLRGKCPKQALEVGLLDCIVVDKEKSPILVVEATDLAKEFSTDLEKARKKYGDKYIIVTGTVVSNKLNKEKEIPLALKGDGDVSVICLFRGPENSEAVVVPEGRRVKVVGQCDLYQKSPRLTWCHIIFEAP